MITDRRRIRVGVLSRAHVHADGYLALLSAAPDVELYVSDPAGGAGTQDRGRHGLPPNAHYLDSYPEVFDLGMDGVVITSETRGHRALVEAAAAAGAAILCEKPLAPDATEALAISAAVRQHRVPFMIAYPVRFMSVCQELLARQAAGQLGELVAIRGTNNGKLPRERRWFVDPVESGGGALFDHVVHVADLIDALTGAAPRTVAAMTNRILHADLTGDAETGGLVLITYDSGLVAAIDCSWSQPALAPTWGGLTLDVTGTRGDVSVDAFRPSVRGLDAGSGRPIRLGYGGSGDERLIATFLETVRGRRSAEPSLEVALRTLSIVLAAAESAGTGRTVAVRPLTAP